MIILQLTSSELEAVVQNAVRKAMISQTTSEKNENSFLTVAEAAQHLNLARQTVYGYTSQRIIPFIKKGKKLYFEREALDNWLASGRMLTREEIAASVVAKKKKS